MPTGRFSNYAILVPVEYHFKREPSLFWRFRPATSRDELLMTTFASSEGTFWDGKGTPSKRYPNIVEIMWREIAILFAGSNIPTSEITEEEAAKCNTQEDVDKLIASFPRLANNAGIEEVEALLAQMPHEMINELWIALGECTPGWGPKKEKKI